MVAAMAFTFTHEKTNNEIVFPEDPKTTIWVQVYWAAMPERTRKILGRECRSETGMGKMPIQSVLMGRVLLQAAGVQSHWGPLGDGIEPISV